MQHIALNTDDIITAVSMVSKYLLLNKKITVTCIKIIKQNKKESFKE